MSKKTTSLQVSTSKTSNFTISDKKNIPPSWKNVWGQKKSVETIQVQSDNIGAEGGQKVGSEAIQVHLFIFRPK